MATDRVCDSLSPGSLDMELARLLWQSGLAPDYSGSRGGMLTLKREMELRGYRFSVGVRGPGRETACAFHPEGAAQESACWVGMEKIPEPLAVSRAALLALRAGPS
jgi:hypothetical protein